MMRKAFPGGEGSGSAAGDLPHALRGRMTGVALAGTTTLGLVTVLEGIHVRGKLSAIATFDAPASSGMYGTGQPGEPLVLALLGDSLAVGLGAQRTEQTVGARLANGLAGVTARPVRLENVAAIGSESADLPDQLAVLDRRVQRPDVALIIIGGNDIMHLKGIPTAVGYLAEAVRALRSQGCPVVVATCPDMGTVRPFVQPLRFVAHWLSRTLAASQTVAVLRAGGRTVSLADMLGPIFRREPALMFSGDSLHPSALGYERAATVLLPSVCAAAGCPTRTDLRTAHRFYTGSRWYPPAWFAFRASRHAGVESNRVRGHEEHLIETGRRVFVSFRANVRGRAFLRP